MSVNDAVVHGRSGAEQHAIGNHGIGQRCRRRDIANSRRFVLFGLSDARSGQRGEANGEAANAEKAAAAEWLGADEGIGGGLVVHDRHFTG